MIHLLPSCACGFFVFGFFARFFHRHLLREWCEMVAQIGQVAQTAEAVRVVVKHCFSFGETATPDFGHLLKLKVAFNARVRSPVGLLPQLAAFLRGVGFALLVQLQRRAKANRVFFAAVAVERDVPKKLLRLAYRAVSFFLISVKSAMRDASGKLRMFAAVMGYIFSSSPSVTSHQQIKSANCLAMLA